MSSPELRQARWQTGTTSAANLMGIFKSLKNAGKWAKNVLNKWGKEGENERAEPIPAKGPDSPPAVTKSNCVIANKHRALGKFSSHRIDNKQRIDGVRVRDLQTTRR